MPDSRIFRRPQRKFALISRLAISLFRSGVGRWKLWPHARRSASALLCLAAIFAPVTRLCAQSAESAESGGNLDFLMRALPLLAGGLVLVLLSARERRNATGIFAALRRRRRKRHQALAMFDNLPMRVFIFDRSERILYAHIPDPEGGAADQPITSLKQIASAPQLERIQRAVAQAFDSGERVFLSFEERGEFRRNEYRRLPGGNPFGAEVVMCTSVNITELYQAHQKTVLQAEQFRLILESIGDGVIATDAQEQVILQNPAAAAMTGFSPEEADGMKLDDLFHIVSYIDEQPVQSPIRQALATGETVELANHTDLIAKDGVRRHIADCASPIRDENGHIAGGVLVFRDVTQEYEKRDQLRINSAVLEAVEKVARIGYFSCAANGSRRIQVAEAYWPTRNGAPVPAEEWVSKKHLMCFKAAWGDLLENARDGFQFSYSAGTPERHFELRVAKSRDEVSGKYEYFGVIQDITHSRERERQASDNLQLLKNIMDNLPGYVFVKNADDQFRYLLANRKFGEMIGVDADTIAGRFDPEIFPMDEAAAKAFREDDRRVIDSGEKISVREHIVTADGRNITVQTIKDCVAQADGTRLLIDMGVDITREYELEQEQKRTIESLDNASRRERIINQSLSMITVEPDSGKAIGEMLRIIGENADADRAYIFLFAANDNRIISNEYEWARSGVARQQEKLQRIDISAFPFWNKALRDRQEIVVPDADAPPEELREELAQLIPPGIRAFLITGIWQNERLVGFVGLDYTQVQNGFDDNAIQLVRSTANLFLLARERAQQVEQVAESALLQKQIVDNISIPIAIIDTEFRFLTANPSFLQQLDCNWEELQEHPAGESAQPPEQLPLWRVLAQTNSDLQARNDTLNWKDHTYIVNTQPIFDRNKVVRYALKSVIDITDINRQKVELKRAMEQAMAADRAKSYFLATMSHELRTPLNAVLGFSELLQDDEISRAEQLEYLRSINCAGAALLSLINDVLDLSKLEAEQMNIAPVKTDLAALLEEMISVFQLKAKQKNLSLVLAENNFHDVLYVDQLRVRQILLNLIGNAIKFTHHGGVAIRAGFRLDGQGMTGKLYIEVADSGIGISAEQQKKVFDPFFQAESTRGNRVYEGSGLGLPISIRLAQRMGGTIKVADNPGGGSSFTLELEGVAYEPRLEPPSPADALKPLPAPLPTRERVLLVDDVPMNLKVLQAMLRKLNIESVCAESGEQALEILKRDRDFKFILTDLWMPGMNGEQFADCVRAMADIQSVMVIAVTADTEAQNSFSAAKFDDILSKPVSIETLRKMFHTQMQVIEGLRK